MPLLGCIIQGIIPDDPKSARVVPSKNKWQDWCMHLPSSFNIKHCLKDCNINWSDVQRKNVVNNVDMSSLRAPWQNSPYKNKHAEQRKNVLNMLLYNKLSLYEFQVPGPGVLDAVYSIKLI